jgi:hypothetical protein
LRFRFANFSSGAILKWLWYWVKRVTARSPQTERFRRREESADTSASTRQVGVGQLRDLPDFFLVIGCD